MHVVILGGGGLGTVLAGYLARTDADVTLLVKPAQAIALPGMAAQSSGGAQEREIRIGGLAEFTVPVRVTADPSALGVVDYLIVCVKARDTEAALAPLGGVQVATVLSLQNGVRKDGVLAGVFGRERVLGGLTAVGGRLERPGVALHTLGGATLVGELDGSTSERGERLADLVQSAGLPAACVPGIVAREWYKLTAFLRTAPLAALTRRDIASVLLDPDLVRLAAFLVHEVAEVAAAEGSPIWTLPASFAEFMGAPATRPGGSPQASLDGSFDELVAAFAAQGAELRAQGVATYPSLAQDIMAGRPSELEDTAGDVVGRAAVHGVPVPTLTTCLYLLRAIEREGTGPLPRAQGRG